MIFISADFTKIGVIDLKICNCWVIDLKIYNCWVIDLIIRINLETIARLTQVNQYVHLFLSVKLIPKFLITAKATTRGPQTPLLWADKTTWKLIKVFTFLKRFNNVTAKRFFDRDFNYQTSKRWETLILQSFYTSIALYFYPINIYSYLECPAKWHNKQQNSEHVQDRLD